MLSSLLVSSLIGFGAVISGYEIKLSNAGDILNFASEVNQGVLYRGATVVLDSDIDFSGELSQKFEHIGKDLTNYFTGTFDGQGHVVRNLTMATSSKHAGLFGHFEGLTISNFVVDSTRSFTSAAKSNETYVGGLIRNFRTNKGFTFFENNINMVVSPLTETLTGTVSMFVHCWVHLDSIQRLLYQELCQLRLCC